MKIKIPYLANKKVEYKKSEVGGVQISILNSKNMHVIVHGKTAELDWKYAWSNIEDQDEWDEGREQEKVLRALNLL